MDTKNTTEQASHEHASDDHKEHSSHDHEDNCTPFCACACCGSVVTIPSSNIDFKGESNLAFLYQIPYIFDYSFEYSSNVWHPPTLS